MVSVVLCPRAAQMIRICSGDAARTLHDQVRAEDTHSGDADTRLGGTIGGTQTGEDDGDGAAHGTEEGLD